MNTTFVSDQKWQERLAICASCEYIRRQLNGDFCSQCDCPPLRVKAKYVLAACPKGKWLLTPC